MILGNDRTKADNRFQGAGDGQVWDEEGKAPPGRGNPLRRRAT
jgi:hypothetical protein